MLSPQFLIWLVPLVALVRGRRGLAAGSMLVACLVLTQVWFPYRYWRLALHFDAAASWLVLVRDLGLLALLAVLVWPGTVPGELARASLPPVNVSEAAQRQGEQSLNARRTEA